MKPTPSPALCPRSFRLALALLNVPCSREACDRIAPASNSPHYIGELRSRWGLTLPCERVPFVTRDGVPSWYGRYYATPRDKERIRDHLARIAAANDEQEKAPPGGQG
ncbi:hypothetical protein [Halomonas sp. PR-M31]|uniref:hypothetical protein n=1 Tax=Halomonas sp. PR-M31 TaxID=1471202 RepID=UPI0006520257|nr:hypothetical protein [Halomonas sp. PR-M31]